MDGTLIDSKKDITISINAVRKANHNLLALSEAFIVEAINMEVRNLPKLFYETEDYEERDRIMFEEHYQTQCVQNPYLYDGVKETLIELKNEGVKLSVATNAPTQFAVTMLTHLEVGHLFDVIIGADKAGASKPDPKMIYEILDFYAYDEKEDVAWMVGDNSKDIQSALGADIKSMFATWGFSPHSDHETVIKHPREVLSIVL
mgnify:CR=1 FL=1